MRILAFALPLMFLGLAGCTEESGGDGVKVEFVIEEQDASGARTPFGSFVMQTDAEHAPKTVENFLAYVDSGYYVNLTIHRVAPGFVVQGGGYESDYKTRHSARPPIPLEATTEERNVQWSWSMARTSAPDSATSEFFINLQDNPSLDPTGPNTGYAVFGHTVSGQETITKMTNQNEVPKGTSFGAGGHYPRDPLVIVSAKRVD